VYGHDHTVADALHDTRPREESRQNDKQVLRQVFVDSRCAPAGTVMSKSVANPWRDRKIAVLAGQKAVKSWIRPLRGK
jgi:hypothetical protein